MKFAIVFAAVVAVASAQFPGFGSQARPRFPPQAVTPFPRPVSPPRPTVPAPRAPTPVVNRGYTNVQNANVLRYDNDIRPDGSYTYALEIDNGISAQAQGTPRALGGNPPVAPIVESGSFGWTSPEGQPIVITYVADENGYQPVGDAIPTPFPIPEAIARSIEYNLKNQKP